MLSFDPSAPSLFVRKAMSPQDPGDCQKEESRL